MSAFALRAASKVRPLPRDGSLDASLALWRAPYDFIADRCRRLGSDVFETRLLLQKTICMSGPEAAEVFYDAELFERSGAAPVRLQKTLLGEGGVQTLDGADHRARKASFMGLMTPDRIGELVCEAGDAWRRAVLRWAARRRVVLYDELQRVLARAACAWAGVPLLRDDAQRRTRQLVGMFDAAGAVGPRHWRSRFARKAGQRWIEGVVADIREGRLAPPAESAAGRIALDVDASGMPLPAEVAATELLNVLRPIVAVSVYVVFAAHALHEHPRARARLEAGDLDYAGAFVDEVRRLYPFFPAVPARVRRDFEWKGHRFRRGTRTLLDLHGTSRDPRAWEAPDAFRPERFLERKASLFDFVPQGGGDPHRGHRCAGEAVTRALMTAGLDWLVRGMTYRVPAQDLRIDRSRLPALPRSRFVIEAVGALSVPRR